MATFESELRRPVGAEVPADVAEAAAGGKAW
jgi:hypothetical protein